MKGMSTGTANHKNVPLYVLGNSGDEITVQTDGRHTASIEDDDNTAGAADEVIIGYIQVCRSTLYKCVTAHSITTGDSIDDLVKPTNVSYWEFGDVCGKRLSSCAKRFGHVADSGEVIAVHVKDTNGVLQQGAGYTSVPTVVFTTPEGYTGSGASATAVLVSQKVVKFTDIVGGSNYNINPTISFTGGGGSGAAAEAKVRYQATDNVNLPFGGFPGASLY